MEEKRIAALEEEVKTLRAAIIEMRDLLLYEGGKSRMFEAAVLSLLGTHHDFDSINFTLNDHLAKVDANVINEALSEAHVKGAQDAAEILRLAPQMHRKP